MRDPIRRRAHDDCPRWPVVPLVERRECPGHSQWLPQKGPPAPTQERDAPLGQVSWAQSANDMTGGRMRSGPLLESQAPSDDPHQW